MPYEADLQDYLRRLQVFRARRYAYNFAMCMSSASHALTNSSAHLACGFMTMLAPLSTCAIYLMMLKLQFKWTSNQTRYLAISVEYREACPGELQTQIRKHYSFLISSSTWAAQCRPGPAHCTRDAQPSCASRLPHRTLLRFAGSKHSGAISTLQCLPSLPMVHLDRRVH